MSYNTSLADCIIVSSKIAKCFYFEWIFYSDIQEILFLPLTSKPPEKKVLQDDVDVNNPLKRLFLVLT